MKIYEVTYESFDHDRYIVEIEAETREDAMEKTESEYDDCYSALFAELVYQEEAMKPKNRKYMKSLWEEEIVTMYVGRESYLKMKVLTHKITGEVK